MDATYFIEAGVVGLIFLTIWLSYHLVSHYKRHRANKELWATIFEGMTNKLVDLEPLKVPDTYIEKKAQKDGQDKDTSPSNRQDS